MHGPAHPQRSKCGIVTMPHRKQRTLLKQVPRGKHRVCWSRAVRIQPSPMLDKETLMKYRERYSKKLGGPPPDFERPTDEQISALKARLDSGLPPYTEFSVFGPYGKRFAKQSKYAGQVWTGSGYVTRQIPGPANVERWCSCWRVFRSTMIMLRWGQH